MRQSKLLELLRSLSGRQLTRLRDFLDSLYSSRSGEILRFYEFLHEYAPEFHAEALQKDAVIRAFAAEKPLNEKRLAYLMNQLQQLTEAFLAIEHFRADELEEAMALLQVLDPAQLPRHYKYALDKARRILEENPYRNADYYLQAFRLSAVRYRHDDLNQHQFSEPLQQASDALDAFYLVEKLRYCWAMANLEYMLNLKYRWNLGEWVLDYLAQENPELNPTARIYWTGILMIREAEDAGHFYALKTLLAEHEGRFDLSERKHLYTGLLNHCTRRINRHNDPVFYAEYLDINKRLLANGLLFENDRLSPWRFLNLVNTGLRTGQVEWVYDFIRQYRSRLPEEYAEDIYLTTMGQYHYHRKEYAEAQVLLNQASPRDVLLAVTVRNLLVRIYYETGETELLLSFLEAYRIYLLRQELLSPQTKKQLRRFVDFTRRLAKIDRPEAQQLPALRDDLPDSSGVYHRDWLLEQMERKIKDFGVA